MQMSFCRPDAIPKVSRMRTARRLATTTMVGSTCACEGQKATQQQALLELVDSVLVQESDTLFVGRPVDVIMGSSGSIYVPDVSQSRVVQIARDGRITSVLGRKGRGPGEFTSPSYLALQGDSILLVKDGGQQLL